MLGREFVERLDFLLKQQGKTKTELYNTLGIANNSFTKWSAGNIPNCETILKLATFFNCSTDYLLTGKSEEIPEEVVNLSKTILSLSEAKLSIIRQIIEL